MATSPPPLEATDSRFTSLVCFLTCSRPLYLRRYAPHYMKFCRLNRDFSFVVSLDGADDASVTACSQHGIPLLYSEHREGVGLSKNRALKEFADYDYYFFVEDDAELLDGIIFLECIRIAQTAGFQHLSAFEKGSARGTIGQRAVGHHEIVLARLGGAQFSFFTRAGLQAVGGWHPDFAPLRRCGHTEHSQRFVNQGLAEAAFAVVSDLCDCLLWHYPPSVTQSDHSGVNPDTQLSFKEEELIQQRLRYVEVQTLSTYHRNDHPLDCSAAPWLAQLASDRYPLLDAGERRRAWSDYDVAMSRQRRGLRQWFFLARAGVRDTRNPYLRQVIKRRLCAREH